MLCIWWLFFILSKLTKFKPFSISFIKNKIESTLQSYKYGAFIRFWITCYLDTFAISLITIQTTTIFIWPSIINYTFAILLIVIYIQIAIITTPLLFFYFSLKNSKKISNDNELNANWGTLFYEFNNDKGLGSSQFYFYFFVRRIFYMIIQFFLQDWPIIQLTLNIVLSSAVIFK